MAIIQNYESKVDGQVSLRGRDNCPALLIEQNARQALNACDRGYILQKGQIVTSGISKELVSDEWVQKAYFAIE